MSGAAIEAFADEDLAELSTTKLIIQALPSERGFEGVYHLELPDRDSFTLAELVAIYDCLSSVSDVLDKLIQSQINNG